MEEPKYRICFKEAILVPKHEGWAKDVVSALMIVFFAGAILLTILGGNPFSGFTLSTWACVVFALAFLIGQSGSRWSPSDTELVFYSDRMVHYRSKRYYTRKKSRREYYIFYYKDITRILYRENIHKMDIFGKMEGVFYTYTKDGNLPQDPSYHKTTDGFTRFYTTMEPDIDFVGILETYTPVKVERVNA